MRLRDPNPAERVRQLEAKLKSLAWKDWQVPTAGQFEAYCELWKEYLAAKTRAEATRFTVARFSSGELGVRTRGGLR